MSAEPFRYRCLRCRYMTRAEQDDLETCPIPMRFWMEDGVQHRSEELCGGELDGPYIYWPDHRAGLDRLRAEVERLTACILDIDAHATPFGEDADGFVSGGYVVSVGSIHRALGAVGHSAAKCKDLDCERAATLRAEVERLRRWQYEACLAIEAASTISQRWATTGSGLNLGNHDRLLAEAGFSPDSAVAALDAGEPAVRPAP